MNALAVVVLRRALTPRERAVLRELVEEPSYKVIAARLGITIHGVRFHVKNIAGKLPAEWYPRTATHHRVGYYALRVHALAQQANARDSAA